MPVPEGGIGRVLIYKTYKDPRTYTMHGEDIVWVRSLSGYRLGVLLPKGFAFLSSNVAAQVTTTADGRLKLAFANPSGQSNPVTIHARKTTATFPPRARPDMFFDDIKTLYDLGRRRRGASRSSRPTATTARATKATLDSLAYLPLQDLKVIDLDTAKALAPVKERRGDDREARCADRRRQAERAPADHRHAEGSGLQGRERRARLRAHAARAAQHRAAAGGLGCRPPCRSRARSARTRGVRSSR